MRMPAPEKFVVSFLELLIIWGSLQPETQVWDSRLAGFYEFGLQSLRWVFANGIAAGRGNDRPAKLYQKILDSPEQALKGSVKNPTPFLQIPVSIGTGSKISLDICREPDKMKQVINGVKDKTA